jgi:hypothetical protein
MADILDSLPAPIERIQRVLRSPRVEVWPLASEHEAPITRFQRHVLEHLS